MHRVLGYLLNSNPLCVFISFSLFLSMGMKVAGTCPASWVRHPFGEYCFKYFRGAQRQTQAAENCTQDGAHLMSIRNHGENALLMSEMNRTGERDAWIGLKRNSKGNWMWPIETPLDGYDNWNDGEPSLEDECARITPKGTWFGNTCNLTYSWVCRIELVTSTASSLTTTTKSPATATKTTMQNTATLKSTISATWSTIHSSSVTPAATVSMMPSATITWTTTKSITLGTNAGSSGQPPTVGKNSDDERDKVLIYAIVGGVLGLVIIIVIIVLLVYMCRRAKPRNEKPKEDTNEDINQPANAPQVFPHSSITQDNAKKTIHNGEKDKSDNKLKAMQLRRGQAYESLELESEDETETENASKKPDSQVQVNVIVNMNPTLFDHTIIKNDKTQSNSSKNDSMPYSEPQMDGEEALSKPEILVASNKPQSGPKSTQQTATETGANQEEQSKNENEEALEDLYAKPMKKKPSQPVPEVTLVENQIYSS